MTHSKNHVIEVLNILIETCKDGEKGFHEAAEAIRIPQYEVYFNEYARLRRNYAVALQNCVREMGDDPDRKGTFAGTIHRGWMHLRSAVKLNDETIIAECKRGEEAALKNYEEALLKALPPPIRTLIESQFNEIKDACLRISFMEVKKHEA